MPAPLASPVPVPAGVRRRLPVHPGRFLARHYLVPAGISQTEAARRLGVSRRRINELVQGKRAMSADTAIRCARVFGLPATHWLALQADWDAWHRWHSGAASLPATRTTPASHAPCAATATAAAR